jgi:urease accessory protein
MLVAETVLGRLDGAFGDGTPVERVVLSDADRKRSRVRTTTDAGTEIGLLLGDESLRPGDVVYADETRVVAVAFEDCEVFVADLSAVGADASTLATLVELGHAVGNRHHDLAVRDGEVLLPVGEDDGRLRDTVEDHLPEAATVRRESVDPAVFDTATGGPNHGHSHAAPGGHGGHLTGDLGGDENGDGDEGRNGGSA